MPVTIRLMQGNLTHDTDFYPIVRMDPYVYVSVGGQRRKSTTCRSGGRTPFWSDVFNFQNVANDMMLRVQVWDKDTFTRDDLIGDGYLDLTPFMNGMPVNQYVNLTYKGRGAGSILVGIQCTPNASMGMGGMGMPMGGAMNYGMNMPMNMPMGANYSMGAGMIGGGIDSSWNPNFTSF